MLVDYWLHVSVCHDFNQLSGVVHMFDTAQKHKMGKIATWSSDEFHYTKGIWTSQIDGWIEFDILCTKVWLIGFLFSEQELVQYVRSAEEVGKWLLYLRISFAIIMDEWPFRDGWTHQTPFIDPFGINSKGQLNFHPYVSSQCPSVWKIYMISHSHNAGISSA